MKSGNTYTWTITSGTSVSVGALKFVVGYTFSYTDSLTNSTVSKTYKAYATSDVENVAQPGGMYVYRERKATWTTHERERTRYVARILGANTFGGFYQYTDDNSDTWTHGYFDFTNSSPSDAVVKIGSTNAANGYGLQIYDVGKNDSDGTISSNTGLDCNRPVSTTYVDRGAGVALSNSNLRVTFFEANNRSSYENYVRYGSFKVLAGEVTWGLDTASNNSARTQLGLSSDYSQDLQIPGYGFETAPFTGTTYGDAATVQDNGNMLSAYTLVVCFGVYYTTSDRICNVSSAINMRIVSYDKSELRGTINEILTEQAPTTKLAAGSEIGIYPQESYYSSGWSAYKTALQNAQFVLADPDTDQNTINSAVSQLETAVAGLVVAEADYTAIDTARTQLTNLNANNYTEASWAAVQTAIRNVVEGYSVFYQCAVDKMADDINNAINNLAYAEADYSLVDAVVEQYESLVPTQYTTESWTALRNAVNEVEYHLTIDRQATVNAYAQNIANKIEALQYALADYSAVNTQVERYNTVLPNKSLYDETAWRRVETAYNAIEWNYDWRYQTEVNDMASSLKRALDALVYKSADYSAVNAALDIYDSLSPSWYTARSFAALTTAVNNVVEGLDITHQSEVDAMATALNNAIAGLVEADGDYSAVETAINNAESLNQSYYTTDSWNNLQNAIDAVDYNLTARYQTTINGYATAINNAINNLVELSADYTAVNTAVARWTNMANKSNYTDASVANVTSAINAVNYNLKKSQQSTVNGYATAINNAIDALVLKNADYSAVNTAKTNAKTYTDRQAAFAATHSNYSYYTPSTYTALQTALNGVTEGLDITHQSEVNAMATAINTAISNLRANTADYSGVDAALATIPADLSKYTDSTAAAVIVARNAVDRSLTTADQDDVDTMAANIRAAVADLELKGADYSAVDAAIATIPSDLSVYTSSSRAAVEQALTNVVRGLNIEHQSEVDAMAAAISNAVAALELDYADYTAVNAAITAANAAIANTNYTDASIAAVRAAIDAVVYNLKSSEQERVNAMATAINNAVEALTYKPLDLTNYNAAVARIPADTTIYTDATVSAVNKALSAADAFKAVNNITKQSEFDALVTALNSAITALRLKGADYTAVDNAIAAFNALNKSLYKDVTAVQSAINAVQTGLDITHQSEVDAMAQAINDAINALEYKDADYSAVIAARNSVPADLSVYTDESKAAVETALDNVVEGLNITQQTIVNAYATDINNAVAALEYKPADYSALDALVTSIEALDPAEYANYDEIYYGYIYSYITSTIPANRNYNITEQASVDAMTAELQGYVDMLIPASQLQPLFIAKEGSTTVFKNNTIYGLKQKLTKSAFESSYVDMENVTVTYTGSKSSRYLGTGTVVTVTSTLTGEVVATYTIIIYGDVDGDGTCNANDRIALTNSISGSADPLDGAYKSAANLNGDRRINAQDLVKLNNVLSGTSEIDQVSGVAN